MSLWKSITNIFAKKQNSNNILRVDMVPSLNNNPARDKTESHSRRPVVTSVGRKPSYLTLAGMSEGKCSVISQLPLMDIRLFLRKEAYVSLSVSRYTNAVLRRGWTLVGKDDVNVSKIMKRLNEISRVSVYSFNELLREYTRSLIAYGNGFMAIGRATKHAANNKTYKIQDVIVSQIYNLQVLNPITLGYTLGDKGFPIKWHPNSNNTAAKDKDFALTDIFYCSIDRDPGELFGWPYIANALNDLKHLLAAEEWSLNQAFAYGSPILHLKVGTDTYPCSYETDENGLTDIDKVERAVYTMDQNGTLVTDSRVSVNFITPASGIEINNTVEKFENRVIAGLGLSPVMLGRSGSSSRASAEVQDTQFLNNATDFQKIIESSITDNLIFQLCVELGIDLDVSPVVFKLLPIDETTARAREVHNANLFNRNTITLDEARELSGLGPISKKEEKRLYTNMFLTHSKGAAKEQTTQAQPENQHGVSPTKPKYRKDSLDTQIIFDKIDIFSNEMICIIGDELLHGIEENNLTEKAALTILDMSLDDIQEHTYSFAKEYATFISPMDTDVFEILEDSNFFNNIGNKGRLLAKKTLEEIVNKSTKSNDTQNRDEKISKFRTILKELRSLRTVLTKSLSELISREIDTKLIELGIIEIDVHNNTGV